MHYQSYPTNELKVVKNHYQTLEGRNRHDALRVIRFAPFRSIRNAFAQFRANR